MKELLESWILQLRESHRRALEDEAVKCIAANDAQHAYKVASTKETNLRAAINSLKDLLDNLSPDSEH